MNEQDINSLMRHFAAIGLHQMDQVQLLNRIDRKYVLPLCRLPEVLEQLAPHYFALEIEGHRAFNYHTTYYDTEDYQFYKDHHNGLVNRVKVRCREYRESKLTFFEIKRKSKGYRTDKYRQLIQGTSFEMDEGCYEKIREQYVKYPFDKLKVALFNRFSRITLVNKQLTERCTIDFGLYFASAENDREIAVDDIAIIEVKQSKAFISPVVQLLRQMRFYPSSISKYVLGLILTHDQIKQNAFKSLLHKIDKIKSLPLTA